MRSKRRGTSIKIIHNTERQSTNNCCWSQALKHNLVAIDEPASESNDCPGKLGRLAQTEKPVQAERGKYFYSGIDK